MTDTENKPNDTHPLWKGLLPLLIFSTLSSSDIVVDIYGSICKPIALFIISLTGLAVSDQGVNFNVAHLSIPWTRDCAGMNILLVLLAIYAWMNRHSPQNSSYWLKMLCMIPLAILSNVLRILTLVAYRYFLYPEVETPQMHYFWGLFWLIPFALYAIPRDTKRSKKSLCFELLHISAVIGLIAPLLNLSNHWVTAIGVLFLLLNSNYKDHSEVFNFRALGLWVSIAIAISWSGIESLWLPWLLVCPLTVNSKWLLSIPGFLCLSASCPLFVLIPYADIWAITIFIFTVLKWHKVTNIQLERSTEPTNSRLNGVLTSCIAIVLFLPFISSTLFSLDSKHLKPPSTIKKKVIQGMGYQLRLNDQSPKLGLLWYDPQGNNRHHALEVCLQYRGIYLKGTELKSVKTDGERWFTEFFIIKDKLVSNHNDYLWQTLGFRKSPGVHLILVADKKDFNTSDFSTKANETAKQLFESIK